MTKNGARTFSRGKLKVQMVLSRMETGNLTKSKIAVYYIRICHMYSQSIQPQVFNWLHSSSIYDCPELGSMRGLRQYVWCVYYVFPRS